MPNSTELRRLAAWYREFADRAGSPVIWEARLLTAMDLEAQADRMEPSWKPGKNRSDAGAQDKEGEMAIE